MGIRRLTVDVIPPCPGAATPVDAGPAGWRLRKRSTWQVALERRRGSRAQGIGRRRPDEDRADPRERNRRRGRKFELTRHQREVVDGILRLMRRRGCALPGSRVTKAVKRRPT